MDDLQLPESEKVTALINRLKALEARINEAEDPEEKVSLLLEHANLYGEFNRKLIETYERLLSESIRRYEEALKVAQVFQSEMLVMSKLLKAVEQK